MATTYDFNYSYTPSTYQTLPSASLNLQNLFTKFDADGASGTHGTSNTGGFFTDGLQSKNPFSGDTYSGSVNNYAYSFTADVNDTIDYNFGAHTVEGSIKSIQLGSGLNTNGTVENVMLSLTFDNAVYGDSSIDGRDNLVHDIIWGLMNGETNGYYVSGGGAAQHGGLQGYLASIGIDLTHSETGYLDATDTGGALPIATLFGEEVVLAA